MLEIVRLLQGKAGALPGGSDNSVAFPLPFPKIFALF